ncbi:MAG: AAA family ATPase [Dysgonamonadaceae bacterium]|nr:AAA family ATPase [Dysgonamonadaceae bacterium]
MYFLSRPRRFGKSLTVSATGQQVEVRDGKQITLK